MATRGQIQIINVSLGTLRCHSNSLVKAVNSHVEQITVMAQSWVSNQGTGDKTFQDISNTIAESVSLILDRVDDFQAAQGAEGGDGRSEFTLQLSTTDSSSSFTMLESSSSLSSPSSERPKSSQPHSDQLLAQILNRLDNIENDSVKVNKRLDHIEKERREVDTEKVKEVEGRLEHIDNSLQDLTTFAEKVQRVEERMQTLPDLGEEVKKLQENRNADLKLVNDIRAEVATFSAQLQRSRKQPVGFTVEKYPCATNLTSNTQVTALQQIRTNHGNHYNPSTGEFTAPADGLYLSSLIHTHCGSGGIRKLQVVCKRNKAGPGGEREEVVCETWTEDANYVSCTDVGVVYMSVGDKLFVKVVDGGVIWAPSVFSCSMIS